jgi:hypothetical protein
MKQAPPAGEVESFQTPLFYDTPLAQQLYRVVSFLPIRRC